MFLLGNMACTKQTPRNPNLERPSAAMGSDVQPERRVPLKLTSKRLVTKGGKQPQKHMPHDIRLAIKNTRRSFLMEDYTRGCCSLQKASEKNRKRCYI